MNNRIARAVLPLFLAGLTLGTASAQAPAPTGPKPQVAPKIRAERAQGATPTVASGTHALEAADVESFLDGLMPLELERADVAGAVVTVVKDGRVLFAKGYGYADAKSKRPVMPETTLFRPGSISKLFTWTAVMQQVEQGKLDLDRDVNDYLDFKIPATFPQPITLRHIMTHQAGFSETGKQLFTEDPKQELKLRDYLVNHMPARLFPPGTTPAYSNYATALAGYIVQRVSGEPFEQYVENHIFRPLDMTHATFRQPLPEALKADMSNGYKEGSKEAQKFEIINVGPAGALSMSGLDAAKFMMAHLQNGTYNGAQILKPETAQLMHTRQKLPAGNALNAMCLGFYEESRNGYRIIGHGGDTVYFHSDMHLVPDANLGFFVSYNSAGNGKLSNLRGALWEKFLDRYLPYAQPTPAAIATAKADVKKLAGSYIVSRREGGNFMGLATPLEQQRVTPQADGTLIVEDMKDRTGQPMRFREIAPMVFQNENGQQKIAFYQSYDGRTAFGIDFPAMVYQRAGVLESKGFNLFVICASLGIMALALVLWPVSAMVRRHYDRKLPLSRRERRLRRWTRVVCIVDLACITALGIIVSVSDSPAALTPALDKWIHLAQVLGVLGVIGCVLAVYNAAVAWRPVSMAASRSAVAGSAVATGMTTMEGGKRWWGSRVGESAVALACLGFAWFLLYWGVLNFSLNY
jgi:CubicO group peptidase (beta-lactamase class C family)